MPRLCVFVEETFLPCIIRGRSRWFVHNAGYIGLSPDAVASSAMGSPGGSGEGAQAVLEQALQGDVPLEELAGLINGALGHSPPVAEIEQG